MNDIIASARFSGVGRWRAINTGGGVPLAGGTGTGELEKCLATLFKRKGKNVMTEAEFLFAVSLDYRWFQPKEAQELLEVALKAGALVRTEDFVRLSFDYKDMDAPLSFRPSPDVLKAAEEEPSLFAKLLAVVADKGGLKKRDAVARINRTQERLGVDVEVAALLVAKDLGADVSQLVEPVRQEILAR